jgi:hypothetical protein
MRKAYTVAKGQCPFCRTKSVTSNHFGSAHGLFLNSFFRSQGGMRQGHGKISSMYKCEGCDSLQTDAFAAMKHLSLLHPGLVAEAQEKLPMAKRLSIDTAPATGAVFRKVVHHLRGVDDVGYNGQVKSLRPSDTDLVAFTAELAVANTTLREEIRTAREALAAAEALLAEAATRERQLAPLDPSAMMLFRRWQQDGATALVGDHATSLAE